MTPAARVAAAIEVLEDILGGEPAEKCLTRWARGNRYAGSKDRAVVRISSLMFCGASGLCPHSVVRRRPVGF